jgi:ribosome-associated protein
MFNPDILHPELKFKAVRSSGKGGQHVNKVSSKIELYFDVSNSMVLTEDQKKLILAKLAGRVNSEGILMLDSQESRSQFRNKQIAIKKFDELIRTSFIKKKARIKSKPSLGAVARRIESKKKLGEKKALRKKKWDE